MPGKGNAAATRYAGVTPRVQLAQAEHEPYEPDPERNARIEADMALAMGFVPAPGEATSVQAQTVQAQTVQAQAAPQPAAPVNGAQAGPAALRAEQAPQAAPVQAIPGQAVPTASAPATEAEPGQAVGLNAHMTVSCWRGNKRLATWSGSARWSGELPARFRARVSRGRLEWQGAAPNEKTLRVATDAAGQGGKSLGQWMHPRATLIVINVVASAQATGSGAIGGTGGEDAKDKPSATEGGEATEPRTPGEAGTKHAPIDIDSLDLDSPLGGLTHNPLADSGASENAGHEAGAGTSESAALDTSGSGHASEATGVEGSGGDKGAREGGGEFAKPGGVTAEQGGVDGEFSRITGQDFGAEQGAIGGEGKRDDHGVRGGGAVLGGMVSVPASLRPLAETLLILEDANPGKLAGSWMRKGLERMTVRRVRKQLRQEATEYAKDRVAKHSAEINRVLRGRPVEEKARYARRLRWDIERQYFDNVAEGTEKEIKRLKARIRRAKTRKAERQARRELRKAERLLEAAKVKPIAGGLPKNHEYAGQALPSRKLPRGYKTKGLRFTEDGFPDFSPHAVKLPNGKRSVKIEYTGSRRKDFRAADAAAGYAPGERPTGHIWHHHQDGTTMQLVPKNLHESVRHTGGSAHYRHLRGQSEPYKD